MYYCFTRINKYTLISVLGVSPEPCRVHHCVSNSGHSPQITFLLSCPLARFAASLIQHDNTSSNMSINPMAAAGGLSRGDQAELQKFLELHNTKDALINLNSMTAHCFDKCISSGSVSLLCLAVFNQSLSTSPSIIIFTSSFHPKPSLLPRVPLTSFCNASPQYSIYCRAYAQRTWTIQRRNASRAAHSSTWRACSDRLSGSQSTSSRSRDRGSSPGRME